ncbi:MAG: sulfite exporter TauE/SafE family protein [Rhodospirillales bacterium]|nr:sulfite exporter TauE/SafE family protein [Rhodospirillales bacterium]
MFDWFSLMIIILTFLLAGTVKGVIGLGLPTVTLALLAAVFDLTVAMALLLIPSFVTNLWQAVIGGHGLSLAKRLWPFLACATFSVWLGALLLTRVDPFLLTGLLGALLITYSVMALIGLTVTIPPRRELWSGPVFGLVNGVLTGLTGSFVVPGVLYLQALGLSRHALIQAMGMLFTLSTGALAVALQGNQLLSLELAQISAVGLVPAVAGMIIGRRIRNNMSETRFRQVFFISLLVLGSYIFCNAVWSLSG